MQTRSDGRLLLIGASSFIARHALIARSQSGPCELIARDDFYELQLSPQDTVVNCTIHPLYKTCSYQPVYDRDMLVAGHVASSGARYVLLSSRKVYDEHHRWGAKETAPATGDGSHYGNNKAITEALLKDIPGLRLSILRISNVFGFEYKGSNNSRKSFFGMMSHGLVTRGVIEFDMHPLSQRDFVPVDAVAEAISNVASANDDGVYNIGCGHPITCGLMAAKLIEGYGSGRIISTSENRSDEFYLDVRKWTSAYGARIEISDVLSAAQKIGEQLRCVR